MHLRHRGNKTALEKEQPLGFDALYFHPGGPVYAQDFSNLKIIVFGIGLAWLQVDPGHFRL